MHFSKLPFEKFVKKVELLIITSLNDTAIVAATSIFGYDKAKIKEGQKLLKGVEKIDASQSVALERKLKLHKERSAINQSVKKRYMKNLQIARIAFDKDAIARKALQLDGVREASIDLWINQVSAFANHLLGEKNWLAVLKKYGIGRKEINDMLSALEKLRSASMLCEQSKTEAKRITEQKRIKVKELQEWVSDYLKIAKIALDENPELYKKLRDDEKQ
jgi:hypothetical protein